jgi:hypothetical protein
MALVRTQPGPFFMAVRNSQFAFCETRTVLSEQHFTAKFPSFFVVSELFLPLIVTKSNNPITTIG